MGFIRLLSTGKLTAGKKRLDIQNFYLAYFYEQAARHATDPQIRISLLEKALMHYQQIRQKENAKGEHLYYSLWHTGLIMDLLEGPWPAVEDRFLAAYEQEPTRGESLEAIIRHYIKIQQWPVAYIFSAFAKDRFLGRPPSSSAKWGPNAAFYHWKVLDIHTAVCFNMGMREEATHTFSILLARTKEQPGLFSPKEIENIQDKVKIIQEPVLS
jgi:hypothetical protein